MRDVLVTLGTSMLVLSATAARGAAEPLGLQPSSAWAVGGSGVGPICDRPPSPGETDWAETAGDGVTLSVVATSAACCDCIRRSARFAVGTTTLAGAHLTGTFVAQNTGIYADGSFRVILLDGTNVLGHTVFATEQRANNNCAGSGETPATLVPSGGSFDIDLAAIDTQSSSTFDALELEVLGYACSAGPTTNAATAALSNVALVATGAPATRIGPMPSPGVMGTWVSGPDVDAGSGGGIVIATGDGGTAAKASSGCELAPATPSMPALLLLLCLGSIASFRLIRRHAPRPPQGAPERLH